MPNPDHIPIAKFREALENYDKTKRHELDTLNAVISIERLTNYLNAIKAENSDVDAVRIHLVANFPKPDEWKKGFVEFPKDGTATSQLTLAFVPATGFANSSMDIENGPGNPKDFVQNGKIHILIPGKVNSGLCPPRCDGNI